MYAVFSEKVSQRNVTYAFFSSANCTKVSWYETNRTKHNFDRRHDRFFIGTRHLLTCTSVTHQTLRSLSRPSLYTSNHLKHAKVPIKSENWAQEKRAQMLRRNANVDAKIPSPTPIGRVTNTCHKKHCKRQRSSKLHVKSSDEEHEEIEIQLRYSVSTPFLCLCNEWETYLTQINRGINNYGK